MLAEIRYALGHILPFVLILESVGQQHGHDGLSQGALRHSPSSRQIIDTVYSRRIHVIPIFARSLSFAIFYQATHYATMTTLQYLIFRDSHIELIAYLATGVMLAGLHLTWTQNTISVSSQSSGITGIWRNTLNKRQWKVLVIPALLHATAMLLMQRMSTYARTFVSFLAPHAENRIALEDILAISFVLAARILLIPASAVLTLVEVSFLPAASETIVPSLRPGRVNARIVDIFF